MYSGLKSECYQFVNNTLVSHIVSRKHTKAITDIFGLFNMKMCIQIWNQSSTDKEQKQAYTVSFSFLAQKRKIVTH